MKFEIYTSRFDVPETLYTSFEAETDEIALKRLEEVKQRPSLAWDNIRMIEVQEERKVRKIT